MAPGLEEMLIDDSGFVKDPITPNHLTMLMPYAFGQTTRKIKRMKYDHFFHVSLKKLQNIVTFTRLMPTDQGLCHSFNSRSVFEMFQDSEFIREIKE